MRKNQRIGKLQDRTTYYVIVSSCICLLLQLYAIPRNYTSIMSMANHGLVIIWYGVGGICILKQLLRDLPKYLFGAVWLVVMLACSLLLAVLEDRAKLVSNVIAAVNFLIFPVMLLYTAFYPIPHKAKTAILLSNIVLSFIFINLYFSGFRYLATGKYGEYQSGAVTLGYSNPNQTAMFLFTCLIGLVVAMFYFKTRPVKWLIGIDALLVAWILYETKSRTTLLFMLVFLAMMAVKLIWGWSKKWTNVVLLIPLGYAFFALFFTTVFIDIQLWGESFFNGREGIYQRYIDNLNLLNFIFGDFNEFTFQNLHNGYVSIAATAGIFSVLYFVKMLKRSLDMNYSAAMSSRYTAVAFLGMLCIILCSSTEAAFFVGGSVYAYGIFMVFALFSQPYTREE